LEDERTDKEAHAGEAARECVMRVLVCGGRDYGKKDGEATRLVEVLDRVDSQRNITALIQGGADGADLLGATWAVVRNDLDKSRHIAIHMFIAQWGDLSHPDAVIKVSASGRRYDAKAGPRRNQRMIDEGKPDLVVAFPGKAGTSDMVRRARAAGVEVMEVN
jgi:hypothetical protein